MSDDESFEYEGTGSGFSQLPAVLIAVAAIVAILVVNATSWLAHDTDRATTAHAAGSGSGLMPAVLRDASATQPRRGIRLTCEEPSAGSGNTNSRML